MWRHSEDGPAHDVLLRRLTAELELRGFDVWLAPQPKSDPAAPLGRVSLELDAEGAATLRWAPREAPSVLVSVSSEDDAVEVAAVQIAELVEAALQDPVQSAEQDERPTEPPRAEAALDDPIAPRWRLGLGLAALVSPGGLGLLGGPHVDASVALGERRRFGLGVDTTASALTAKVRTASRAHRIGVAALRAHALWWPRPLARVQPGLGIGGGTMFGWAAPGGTTAVALVSTRGDLIVSLTDRWALWTGARIDLAWPKIDVRSGTQTLASGGQPLFDVSVGVQVRGGS